MASPSARVPKKWIRNKADELAVRAGCRFDPSRGEHVIDFITSNCRLYEGTRFAGKPVELMPYQIDFLMRLFSWVVYSKFLKGWKRRFRRARLWVPKKNGKSPTAAMVGTYLTTADGELGGKTYVTGKDGKQGRIVLNHAAQMVLQSPNLRACCEVTNDRIVHLPTTSFMGIIAGDNVDGQEGLNGNDIIDEGHVVDAKLAAVLEYMGASREEPIDFMGSTAGNNLDGWGKGQWDYGELVNKGEIEDIEFLHVAYAASQTATDEELLNPRTWRQANPAMGYIIDPEVFERELRAAKAKSPAAWSKFKMYRFNIWQRSQSPWISTEDWDACAGDYTLADFAGATAYLGFDGSLSGDMTCVNVIVPIAREGWEGDPNHEEAKVYHLWPMLYITRSAVEQWGDKVPFERWAAAGHLTIVESNQIDYQLVEDDAVAICQAHGLVVKSVTYDVIYAASSAQKISDRLGCEHVPFKQSLLEYAEPAAMFERLLKLRLIRHPKNAVFTWQAGHVECTHPNRQGWIMPVKPQSTDKRESRQAHKSIDGISSSVMGLREARKFVPYVSYYETGEFESG